MPDTVYLIGSNLYGEQPCNTNGVGCGNGISNGREVLYSDTAGDPDGAATGAANLRTFTDLSYDATINHPSWCAYGPYAFTSCVNSPNGIHPDQHAIVANPGNPTQIFEGSDGGVIRTTGDFADVHTQCDSAFRAGGGPMLPGDPGGYATCQQLLSAVPTFLYNLNKGLSTLQFQSLSVAADNPKHLQGGTQDNGTFETTGSAVVWPQIIYGDGGQSGFNAGNSALRFNSFTSNFHDVNFQNGDPVKWVIASGPIVASGESALFYSPIIADPVSAGTIFQGSLSVWRTQDWAGNQAFLEANCPEFTTSGANPACGDFVAIGPTGATRLTVAAADYRGTTRSGGNVAALARASSDTATLWAATTTGRVFISKNADAMQKRLSTSATSPTVASAPDPFALYLAFAREHTGDEAQLVP